MATLTSNINYLQPTSFKITIDRKNFPNLEFFCQDFTHPGMIMNAVEVPFRKLQSIPFVGDKLTFNELLANIIVDENMDAYNEMYNWMRTNLDNNENSRLEDAGVRPPTVSDIVLSILSSHNNVNRSFIYRNAFPVSVGQVPFTATSTEPYLTFPVSFRFDYFDFI